jgi:hypothetical protein
MFEFVYHKFSVVGICISGNDTQKCVTELYNYEL